MVLMTLPLLRCATNANSATLGRLAGVSAHIMVVFDDDVKKSGDCDCYGKK